MLQNKYSSGVIRMIDCKQKALMGACALTAIVSWAPSGFAQQVSSTGTDDAGTTHFDEIVVTARRKAETLQDVPLSISAFSAAELKAASATNLQDISFLTPGLIYTSNGAQANAAPTIRGLSDTSGGEATSQNVSVFLDGVYISNPSAIDVSVGGLERVEIVKGPVSGLYGRNAFTGAINYVTAIPTNEFHADADVTMGDAGRRTYSANLSGPILPDIIKGRVAVTYDRLGGTFQDPATGEYGNGYRKKDAMVKFSVTPDEHISFTPMVYYGDDVFTSPVAVTYAQNCAFGTSNSYCGNLNHNQIGPFIGSSDGSGAVGLDRKTWFVNLDSKFTYFWGSIDLLAGYNNIQTESINEFDGTDFGVPYALYPEPFPGNDPFTGSAPNSAALAKNFFGNQAGEHDRSLELRYDSPSDLPIRGGIGGYYLNHDATNQNTFGIDGKNIPVGEYVNFIAEQYVTSAGQSAKPLNYAESITRDKSEFLSAEWDIVPTVTFSAAGRYTDEQQVAKIGAPETFAGYKHFYSVTSNGALTWKPDSNTTFYINAANGEKSGGFNGAATGPADLVFNPETDVSFEAGTKLSFLDHHLTVNADVFHTTLAQLQVLGPPSTANAIGLVVKNFGDVSANGFELETNYDVGNGLTGGVGVGYSDPKFVNGSLDFSDGAACAAIPSCAASRLITRNGVQAVNLHGLKPPYSSDWTANTTAQYRQLIGFQDFYGFFRVDYRFESKQFNTVTNFASYGPRQILNLHAGVDNKTWKAELFMLNATNNQTPLTQQFNGLLNGFDAPPYGSFGVNWIPTSVLPEGRTYGAHVSYHF